MDEAIRLNGVDAERNLQAFLWGRKYYEDARCRRSSYSRRSAAPQEPLDLVDRRAADLDRYQNGKYAEQYRAFVNQVAAREPALADPVSRYLFKLMAYKDEYEVASLLTQPEFDQQVHDMWESVRVHQLQPASSATSLYRLKEKVEAWPVVPAGPSHSRAE